MNTNDQLLYGKAYARALTLLGHAHIKEHRKLMASFLSEGFDSYHARAKSKAILRDKYKLEFKRIVNEELQAVGFVSTKSFEFSGRGKQKKPQKGFHIPSLHIEYDHVRSVGNKSIIKCRACGTEVERERI